MLSRIMDGRINIDCEIMGLNDVGLDSSIASLHGLPVEIRSSTFGRAMQYLKDLGLGSIAVYRNKIMFVGDQAVGKTSLYQCLNPLFAQFQQRHVFGMFGGKEVIMSLIGARLTLQWADREELTVLSSKQKCAINGRVVSVTIDTNTTTEIDLRFVRSMDLWLPPIAPAFMVPSSNLVMEFSDIETAQVWWKCMSHWTNNSATEGIETSYRSVALTGGRELRLCSMDFAGQAEFVQVCFNALVCYCILDSTTHTSTFSATERCLWYVR